MIWLPIWLATKNIISPIESWLLDKNTKYFCCFYHTILFTSNKRCWIKVYTFFIMKIPKKRGLQQIAFDHSSDIGFEEFMNLYKKCPAKQYCFLFIDTTLASDNLLRF